MPRDYLSEKYEYIDISKLGRHSTFLLNWNLVDGLPPARHIALESQERPLQLHISCSGCSQAEHDMLSSPDS